MGVFEQFPYTNFHGVNLSWILEKVRDHETRITSLESRMTTAEEDIDKLQTDVGDVTQLHTTDKSSLVAAVNENEGRLDTAENDIDALETQVPKAVAGDAGKVLTATGAGSATWQDVPKELPASLGTAGQVLAVNSDATGVEWKTTPIYIEYDADDIPDIDDFIGAAEAGIPVYLRHTGVNIVLLAPMYLYRNGANHKIIAFQDPDGIFCGEVGLANNPAEGLWLINLLKDNGVKSWFAGHHTA